MILCNSLSVQTPRFLVRLTWLVLAMASFSLQGLAQTPNTANQNTGNQRNQENQNTTAYLINRDGFSQTQWGQPYTEVRNRLRGRVLEDWPGEFVITRDGELTLRYGFFPDPAETTTPTPPVNNPAPRNTPDPNLMTSGELRQKQINDAARLFYVSIQMPYIRSLLLEKKLEDRFGASKGKRIEENRGVIWWEWESNLVLLWIDNVSGEQYTRKIDVIGKQEQSRVMGRQKDIYNEYEKKILNNLSL